MGEEKKGDKKGMKRRKKESSLRNVSLLLSVHIIHSSYCQKKGEKKREEDEKRKQSPMRNERRQGKGGVSGWLGERKGR